MDKITSLVKQQYTDWPYPDPIGDIALWRTMGWNLQLNLEKDHNLLWPERRYNPRLSILIAGCGTREAAIQAFNYPQASVLGIDLSETSIELTDRLKKRHSLKNLKLKQMDLRDIADTGRKFDLVISFGVLHHLADPQEGLMALSSALKDDGVIFMSLYGKYGRIGVSMIQEALRLLKLGQTEDDIKFVRQLLMRLPTSHPVQNYLKTAEDLHYDSGVVDTFLHPQEKTFSVPDILALVKSSKLIFHGWYYNELYLPHGSGALYERITALPLEEQWAVIELLSPLHSGHSFMLRKSKLAVPSSQP